MPAALYDAVQQLLMHDVEKRDDELKKLRNFWRAWVSDQP